MKKIYGEWIDSDGKRIVCKDQCSHTRYCSYDNASDNGWIAIAYGEQYLCIRLNPATTSRRAYSTAIRIIKEHDGERVLLEDVCANLFGNIDSQNTSKTYITRIIQQLKAGTLILTERFHPDRPYHGYAQLERKKRRDQSNSNT